MSTAPSAERPLRADARRNRERVLAVAAQMFAEQGHEVGVAEIARGAGVGSATLFRHFPTKEALIAAVVEQRLGEVEALLASAQEIEDPGEAFRTLMLDVVRAQVQDRALVEALIDLVHASSPRIEEHIERVTEGVGAILGRAQEAGLVRDDVVAGDIMALASGIASAHCPDLQRPDLVERYLGIVLDGLGPQGASPLHPGPATFDDLAAARLRCGS